MAGILNKKPNTSADAEVAVVEKVEVEATTTAAVDTAPAFEAVEEVEVEASVKPEATGVLAAAKQGMTMVKPTAHLLSAGTNVSPLRDLKDAFKAQDIDVSYNTFPRYRDDKGVIGDPEGNEAGSWLELMLISWNDSWTITPGDDSDKSKEHLRYSQDGVTIHSEDDWNGRLCTEYVTHLNELGYEKAAIKKYTQLYGLMVDAEQPDCPGLQNMIQLALAPTSGALWNAYLVSRSVRARMGKVQETSGNPVVRFTSKRAKSGTNTFYKLEPTDGLTPPAI